MSIQKLTLTVELDNDEFMTPERIIHADRKAAAATAKKRGWTEETHPMDLLAFMAWHATKRAGQHDETFAKFEDRLIDVHQELEEVDPTQPAGKNGSTSS